MISETRKIGDRDYKVTMLPLSQWQALRSDFWPILMGVLPDVVDVDSDAPPTEEKLCDVVRSASVLLPLHPERYNAIIKLLHNCSEAEGQAGYLSSVAEMWWAEKGYAEMGEWIAFALEVQMVPFLLGMPLASLRRLSKAKESASRTTSIGASGGLSAGGTGA